MQIAQPRGAGPAGRRGERGGVGGGDGAGRVCPPPRAAGVAGRERVVAYVPRKARGGSGPNGRPAAPQRSAQSPAAIRPLSPALPAPASYSRPRKRGKDISFPLL